MSMMNTINGVNISDVSEICGVPLSSIAKVNGVEVGYKVPYSCRFDTGDYLNLNMTTDARSYIFTISAWVKLDSIAGDCTIASCGYDGSSYEFLRFTSGYLEWKSVSKSDFKSTTQYNAGEWLNVVMHMNSTRTTASNRMAAWVNGEEVSFQGSVTYPPLNNMPRMFANWRHGIGAVWVGSWSTDADCYMAESIGINGLELGPEYFGKTVGGAWVPIEYTGSYGTNGWYFPFTNASNMADNYSGSADWDIAGTPTQSLVTPTS